MYEIRCTEIAKKYAKTVLMTDLLGCVPILVYELLNGFTVDETRVREMIDGRLYFFLFSLKIFKLGMLPRLFVFASIVY